jgi:glycosyltransferase involved in cell wall biosynthesis
MQTGPIPIRLVLFFTSGVSLRKWDSLGMFDREVALYQRLQRQGVEVTFVTYGDAREQEYRARLPGIRICCNRWGLPSHIYERLIPILHPRALGRAQLYKTNQIPGGPAALASSRLYGKPLIARCGYMWSEFMGRRHGPNAHATFRSQAMEWQMFGGADRVVVTTDAMRQSVVGRQPWLADNIRVVPNYVDTELFCPGDPQEVIPNHLCYIGRLDEAQKNLLALVEAVDGLDVTLDLIGEGIGRPTLEKAAARNPRIRLIGGRPHSALPEHLRRAALFVLPSHYEGHPKTLIEAMACGVPIVATDVPGIREVVRHGETAALCSPQADALRIRIAAVLADADLRKRMGRGAREYAVQHYSLDRIVARELAIYRELVQNSSPGRRG